MNLVIQGLDIETRALKELAKLTGAQGIQRITGGAFRLLEAQQLAEVATYCESRQLDHAYVPEGRRLRDYGLFVTDMDSTLIGIECIDEIADMQGLKAEVAAITEAAMRGEIAFGESLTRRVSLLKGLDEGALARVYEERLTLNPGAEQLMRGLRQAGLRTVLVSGGFTYFTDRLRERLGFDHAVANRLEIENGRLTGRIVGDIVDAAAKRRVLESVRDEIGLLNTQTIAAGDGANDLEMLEAAAIGVAYHAKPVVRVRASYAISHAGLDAILNLFG
ncbi:MAG: phosphoserine phosphatase SerB [Rhodocyclaceae bacterium]|nr:phosphoserine phosphatase SerB [Rhodocyclaceae bacterium]MCP5239022.1 phosphoserine phosphatase SerB [Zoogloeaceae bacterium]MCP5254090.1 phosphoserine phosphatase SerB [Zoogloeaceae bacterium]MCP5295265.1 phosphoserine phosphatase SerB [Zoogloeaceae bacterium]